MSDYVLCQASYCDSRPLHWVRANKEAACPGPSRRCSMVAQLLRPTTLTAAELAAVMPGCSRMECRLCPFVGA